MTVIASMWCHPMGEPSDIWYCQKIWLAYKCRIPDLMLQVKSDTNPHKAHTVIKWKVSGFWCDILDLFLTSYKKCESVKHMEDWYWINRILTTCVFCDDFMNNSFNILRYIIQILYWVPLVGSQCHEQVLTNCQQSKLSSEHTDYYTNETKLMQVVGWEFILKGVELGVILQDK